MAMAGVAMEGTHPEDTHPVGTHPLALILEGEVEVVVTREGHS